MSIDRKIFYANVRLQLFDGHLSSGQVEGMDRILDEWERRKLTDLRWLANMLAQTFHETGEVMQPVREKGTDAYLRAKPYWPWIGEGLIQVTWEVNGRKFGAKKPGDCMSWSVALSALFDGMIKGMFTGVSLKTYFNARKDDPVNARRIINALDQAQKIAGYHHLFLHALTLASQPGTAVAIDKPAPALAKAA